MSELPKGWFSTELENLFSFVIGGDWGKALDHNEDGFTDAYCIRGTEFRNWDKEKGYSSVLRKVKTASLEKRALKVNDILIEISGGGPEQPVGRTILIDEKSIKINRDFPKVCTNFVRLARPYEQVNSSFLNYYLRSFYLSGEVKNYQGGSNNLRNLKFKDYSKIQIPLAPLNEQKRIADKLDSLLAKVDKAQARLDQIPTILKRFRQSVLAAATSGELTKEWRGNYIDNYVLTDKYTVPKAWDLQTFEDLTEVVTSGSRGWAKFYSEQGSTFIRAQNINSDCLNLSDIAYVSLPEKAEGRRTKVERDDLLITITGANVTKAARVKDSLADAYVSQHVALIKLKNNDYSSFIELFIKAENSGRAQLLELAYGGGKPGLNLQNIKGLKIALPPHKEQKEIVSRVEALFAKADKAEKQYKNAKARIDRLTQSILAKAFRGELVAQYENDEPAEQLLARIQELMPKPKAKRKVKK